MELLILYKLNILTMLTWGFGEMSKSKNNTIFNCTNSCIFNNISWKQPIDKSGFLLLGIALVLALIIILIKALHTASTRNTIIMFMTLIMMVIGVGLLTAFEIWYEQIVASIVPVLTLISAILLGLVKKGFPIKWRIILFTICFVLIIAGIVFIILGIICKIGETYKIVLPILSAICWCGAMFI
ncbi:unnamed protein product, partial [Schistosoma turkestanicum]